MAMSEKIEPIILECYGDMSQKILLGEIENLSCLTRHSPHSQEIPDCLNKKRPKILCRHEDRTRDFPRPRDKLREAQVILGGSRLTLPVVATDGNARHGSLKPAEGYSLLQKPHCFSMILVMSAEKRVKTGQLNKDVYI